MFSYSGETFAPIQARLVEVGGTTQPTLGGGGSRFWRRGLCSFFPLWILRRARRPRRPSERRRKAWQASFFEFCRVFWLRRSWFVGKCPLPFSSTRTAAPQLRMSRMAVGERERESERHMRISTRHLQIKPGPVFTLAR